MKRFSGFGLFVVLVILLLARGGESALQVTWAKAPTEGGALDITGSELVADIVPLAVEGLSSDLGCTSVTFVSATNVQAVCPGVPAGTGKPFLNVVLNVSGTVRTFTSVFVYKPPKVDTVAPLSLPTEGANITITGTNFGATVDTATVTVGEGVCNCTMVTPHSKMICMVPPGTGIGNTLVIVVSSQRFDFVNTFISYYAPSIATATGHTNGLGIVITGSNFGQTPSQVLLTISDVTCSVLEATHKRLLAVCSEFKRPGAGLVGWSTKVTVNGQSDTEPVFNFIPATVSNLVENHLPVDGTLLGIRGTDFGAAGTNCTAMLGSVECGGCVATNHSFATCTAAPATLEQRGTLVRFKLFIGGVWASGDVVAIYNDFDYSEASTGEEAKPINPYNIALPVLSVLLAVALDVVVAVLIVVWLRRRKQEARKIEMGRFFPALVNQPVETGAVSFVADTVSPSMQFETTTDGSSSSLNVVSVAQQEPPAVLLDSLGNIVYVHPTTLAVTNAAGVPMLLAPGLTEETAFVRLFDSDGSEVYRAMVSTEGLPPAALARLGMGSPGMASTPPHSVGSPVMSPSRSDSNPALLPLTQSHASSSLRESEQPQQQQQQQQQQQ